MYSFDLSAVEQMCTETDDDERILLKRRMNELVINIVSRFNILDSGTKLYMKKEYIGTLEQRFGTLMMKTYVQSYTQDY